jgi:hypothetical protein
MIGGFASLAYFGYASHILPESAALVTFWILFVLGIGPSDTWLKVLKAVLAAILNSLS